MSDFFWTIASWCVDLGWAIADWLASLDLFQRMLLVLAGCALLLVVVGLMLSKKPEAIEEDLVLNDGLAEFGEFWLDRRVAGACFTRDEAYALYLVALHCPDVHESRWDTGELTPLDERGES